MGMAYINSDTGKKVRVGYAVSVGKKGNKIVYKIVSGGQPLYDPQGYYRRARWKTRQKAQAVLDSIARLKGWPRAEIEEE